MATQRRGIVDLRKAWPQYKDMSNDEFVKALHKKYYADKPISDLYKSLDMESQALRDAKASDALSKKTSLPGKPFIDAGADAFTFGLSRHAGAAGAGIAQGAKNLVDRVQGKEPPYSAREAYDAQLQVAHDEAVKHPWQSGIGGVLGGMSAPGMEGVARFVAGNGARGALASQALLPTMARSATAGGALGGVSGALNAEPGKMMDGALRGAVTGATVGVALPGATRVTGAAIGAGTRAARAAGRAAGFRGDPQAVASRRLAEALRREELAPAQIRTVMAEWRRLGNDAPALLDVARRNGPVQRLLRGAAASDLASADAGQYADDVAGNIQDRATNLTRRLTPDEPRHADAYAAHLEDTQGRVATEMYPDAYAQPVEMTEGVELALSGAPGRAAVQRASQAAEAQMRPEQVAELAALREGAQVGADQPLTAATLDRARIAMNERGRSATQRNARDLGAGYHRRADMIDEALDEVPGLEEARGAYRGYQAQRDAVDLGRSSPMADPEGYAAQLGALEERAPDALRPGVRQAAGVGLRTDLVNAIGSPAEGSTGTLNRLSSGRNAEQVLETTFGRGPSAIYRQGLANETSRLRNARMVDSSQGSQTAGRLEDRGLVSRAPPITRAQILAAAIDRIRSGMSLTDEERQAIVQLGTRGGGAQEVEEQLERLMHTRDNAGAITSGLSVGGANASGQYP